ncbi:MAG TPA: lysophospholipid acyltransferase family protein [Candidatus Kryptonia bacterium]|nr:lysophospholipid acyltransferase family protein [Candidatus Kryptonia bacterium]
MESRPLLAQLTQALRFDGLWWRKFAYLGCVYGPEWWKRYAPPAIAAIIFALIGRNRRGAISNFERILADHNARRSRFAALRMFAEFAHCMTETMEYYGPRPHPIELDLPVHDPLAEALREGRGAVVVTGHFGNWDIAAKTLRDYDRPINIVMAREVNATTQEYVRSAREQVGVRVLFSDTSVFSSLNMIRALRANEIVAIQLDRMLGPGGARMIPFFGARAPFPSGPFVLARLAGAPVVPVFIPRLGTRHYAVRVGRRFRLGRDARDTHVLDRIMTEVVGEFEAIVREFPTQWFQFAPFWPAAAQPVAAPLPSTPADAVAEQRRVRR